MLCYTQLRSLSVHMSLILSTRKGFAWNKAGWAPYYFICYIATLPVADPMGLIVEE